MKSSELKGVYFKEDMEGDINLKDDQNTSGKSRKHLKNKKLI